MTSKNGRLIKQANHPGSRGTVKLQHDASAHQGAEVKVLGTWVRQVPVLPGDHQTLGAEESE